MKSSTAHRVFLVLSLVLITGLVITGLSLIDSPITARKKNWDQEKRNELRQLSDKIGYYFDRENELPETLEALASDPVLIRDNQSKKLYEYNLVATNQFELCADFNLAYKEEDSIAYRYPEPTFNTLKHTEGRNCFTYEVEPSDDNLNRGYSVRLIN